MVRILIIDDANFMRHMIGKIIEQQRQGEFEIVGEAENGEVGVEMYTKLRPDIVTMDITMPKKDGIATVKEIKALDPQANIIMISALGQESKILEAITAGAKDFIVKPFKPERLIEAIERNI